MTLLCKKNYCCEIQRSENQIKSGRVWLKKCCFANDDDSQTAIKALDNLQTNSQLVCHQSLVEQAAYNKSSMDMSAGSQGD
jgi:hypothetical protein